MTHRRGFTLIELLVVVAIIALLISILLPSLNGARDEARRIVCLSTTRQYGAANAVYAGEYNNWYVPTKFGKTNDWTSWTNWTRLEVFRDMLGLQGAPLHYAPAGYLCPLATRSFEFPHSTETNTYNIAFSYGMNVTAAGIDPTLTPATVAFDIGNAAYVGYFAPNVRNPSGKMQLGDAVDWWIRESSSHLYPGEIRPPHVFPAFRHTDGMNVQYFDGHADYQPRTKISTQIDGYHVDGNEYIWFPYR